jgi:hypothetical protein
MNDPGGIRASDAEREAVVERLREASVEGRLTLSELTERTEAVYLAATHAELAQITADLPGGTGFSPDASVTPSFAANAPHVAAPSTGKARRWYVAIMGDTKRRGKWRVDQEIGAVAVMGDVTIDLREAEVRTNEIDIVATAVMGDVKIIVPDGVDVDLSGVAIMGDKKVRVVEAPPGHNVPVVRVRAYVVMGDVKVVGDSRAEPIKRAWFAWSEWWWERRAGAYRDTGEHRHAVRDAHRHERREQRRNLRHGGPPMPPAPPGPPMFPPPAAPPMPPAPPSPPYPPGA